ncbi:CidA/LrgA family protein [Clostridium gasigenes]|uniref:CidA/LrgA family protein n=1 Tax=Clostridium gasigenes TaxID=94869 RepID=A0A1H0MLA0_9CLOT|nr:CidA/LrgA family protein [Clostridium gasigenes]MBB6622081.1 CidA/LrgA family protein [Clostridium gasigenes]MBB6713655.1 CidA/LrgA family protein [Clostridium gasigenes]MBU3086920.1 CidA/LrgA family protein [Clostridium gasigenes]MBU3102656.1 CidA/LrgA family protein [Clostridium gasigenes]MBU3106372.1 CidA/LrgA family protein [Clostridium gasigenes]
MKIFREALIILSIYLIGEIISKGLSLPVPGNIIGMIILLTLLCSNIIKLEKIETISSFFLDHLAFFFIPAGVGLLTSFDIIKSSLIQILLICIISTSIIIAVTGLIVQCLVNRSNKSKLGRSDN